MDLCSSENAQLIFLRQRIKALENDPSGSKREERDAALREYVTLCKVRIMRRNRFGERCCKITIG